MEEVVVVLWMGDQLSAGDTSRIDEDGGEKKEKWMRSKGIMRKGVCGEVWRNSSWEGVGGVFVQRARATRRGWDVKAQGRGSRQLTYGESR